MNRFDDLLTSMGDDEDKAYVRFSYTNCGKTIKIDNEYPYDCTWKEVLDDVVKYGFVRGEEPYNYVRDIFLRYEHYQQFIER